MIENQQVVVLASAARVASNNSDDQVNRFYRGVEVVADVTAVPGVDTVTFTVEGQDPVSKKWYTLLASAAISAQSTVSLTVYPGVTVAANAAASRPLPRAWRVKVTHSAGTSFTYSVGASLIR